VTSFRAEPAPRPCRAGAGSAPTHVRARHPTGSLYGSDRLPSVSALRSSVSINADTTGSLSTVRPALVLLAAGLEPRRTLPLSPSLSGALEAARQRVLQCANSSQRGRPLASAAGVSDRSRRGCRSWPGLQGFLAGRRRRPAVTASVQRRRTEVAQGSAGAVGRSAAGTPPPRRAAKLSSSLCSSTGTSRSAAAR
jgi:hypothetical protein